MIKDKKSMHGTRVNGVKIDSDEELETGDRLEFGSTVRSRGRTYEPSRFRLTIDRLADPYATLAQNPGHSQMKVC